MWNKIKYSIYYLFASSVFIQALATLTYETDTRLGGDIHWSERYYSRLEYYRRRIKGIDTTYEEVFNELIIKPFQKAIKEFEENKKKIKKRLGYLKINLYIVYILITKKIKQC